MEPHGAVRGATRALDFLMRELETRAVDQSFLGRRSRLEGWTNAHVLAHIARTADGYRRMIDGVISGEPVDMYPGGLMGRNAEIDAGATQPVDALLADLVESDLALGAAYQEVDAAVWGSAAQRWGDQPWPAFDVPFMRWREVAVHTVDLDWDLGPAEAWSAEYVEREFQRQLASLSTRLLARQIVSIEVDGDLSGTLVVGADRDEVTDFAVVAGTAVDLLAWMLDRSAGRQEWPDLSPWKGAP